jgi:integrase
MSQQERLGEIDGFWLSWHPTDKGRTGALYRTWYDTERRQTRRSVLQPSTANLQEAKVLLAEWVTNHRVEQLKVTPNKTPDVTPLSMVFLSHWEKHASKIASAQAVKNSLAVWGEFWGNAMISDLTPMRQDDFIRWMQAKGWSNGYIFRILADGRSALNRAKKYQEVTDVPFIFSVRCPEPPERALTMQQLATIINRTREFTPNGAKVPGRDHLFMFILVGIATWARPDAIFDLTRDQVNFDSRRIALNPEGRGQTKKYRPVVAMPDFITEFLKHADHQIVNYYGRKVASVRGFFQDLQGTQGLPDWLQAKSIRHTMAKHARAAGVDDWHVSGQLGHRKPGRSTTEIYAKYDPSYLSETRQFTDDFVRQLQKLVRPSLGVDR